jgi:hypothetical protein
MIFYYENCYRSEWITGVAEAIKNVEQLGKEPSEK